MREAKATSPAASCTANIAFSSASPSPTSRQCLLDAGNEGLARWGGVGWGGCMPFKLTGARSDSQVKGNYFAERCSGSEEGSYLRLIDWYITQL